MSPDYVFISAGAIAALSAVGLALLGLRRNRRVDAATVGLLACLSAGLLVQGASPNLKIERNSFVVPAAKNPSLALVPREIVERERQMKLLSALLVGIGGIGLLLRHRGLLLGAESIAGEHSPGENTAFAAKNDRASLNEVVG